MSEYLFPQRLTRRDFLQWSGVAAAGLTLASTARAADPVKLGSGAFTYTLVEGWGELPKGMNYGLGCATVVDSQDRVYVTSRSENPCVAVFDKDGQLLETWAKDFADKVGSTTQAVSKTAHGLYWSLEPGGEFFYFTENKPGNRVYKTDLKGQVLYTLGAVADEGSTSQKFDFTNPTDVAVAPNGDIYIVDGYGSQLVHRFDKNFKHLKTMGGKGKDHGQFNICHGVWVSTLKGEPEVYIADRANNRIEIFSPELTYLRTIEGVRLPCCFYQHGDHLFVPELGARVSVIDRNDQIVAQLGDGAAIKPADIKSHPEAFARPHALTLDSQGNLYVLEWLDFGRARKFQRTPA
jgi:peptidylamidoglycolate lyase